MLKIFYENILYHASLLIQSYVAKISLIVIYQTQESQFDLLLVNEKYHKTDDSIESISYIRHDISNERGYSVCVW